MAAPITPQSPPSFPLDIRKELFNPITPWEVSKELFARLQVPTPQAKYRKARILPEDKEWRFIWKYFYFQKPVKYGIKQVHFIHERHQQKTFEFAFSSIEREADSFPPTWDQESRAPQRAQTIKRWQEAAQIFSPFTTQEPDGRNRHWKATKIIPLWHGTSEDICDSICTSGFVFFGKNKIPGGNGAAPKSTDEGYFGSGIYFTNSARYAADIYSKGHLLLGWVSMREPFPVVGDPNQTDMNTLLGKSAYKNYNAHYVPVSSVNPQDPDCAEYHPVQENQSPNCDEYVIFQKAQALAQYWVELEVELPYIIIPGDTPQSVRELLPHIMNILQNPQVDKDEKLRNFLNKQLTILLKLPIDEDLSREQIELYELTINLLTPQGAINKAIRDQMFAAVPAKALVFAQELKNEATPKSAQNLLGDEEKGPPIGWEKKMQNMINVALADKSQHFIQPKEVETNAAKVDALTAVRKDGLVLKKVSEQLKSDRDVVLAAVQQNAGAYRHASDQLKNDREFTLTVVEQQGVALQFAIELFKNDKEIVLAAVKENGFALQYASPQLQNDREFVLTAIKQNEGAFGCANAQFRNNKEFVLSAVRIDGLVLKYASEKFKINWEIVLNAVMQNGRALEFANELFKNDRVIALAAVKNDRGALSFVSTGLKDPTTGEILPEPGCVIS